VICIENRAMVQEKRKTMGATVRSMLRILSIGVALCSLCASGYTSLSAFRTGRARQQFLAFREPQSDFRQSRCGRTKRATQEFEVQSMVSGLKSSAGDQDGATDSVPKLHEEMMSENELSHMMIKVASVNETLAYFSGRGATTQTYRYNAKSGSESAFANFAPQQGVLPPNNRGYFSLEITSTRARGNKAHNLEKETGSASSNVIQFVGLSMLTNFQDKSKLESVIRSSKPSLPPLAPGMKNPSPATSALAEVDPNGIAIQSVASAPGDGLARVCLSCQTAVTTLSEIEAFYVDVLGMQVLAQDANCVCLRYQSAPFASKKDGDTQASRRVGVPTTLIFSIPEGDTIAASKADPKKDCFDHLVIATENVEYAMQHIKKFIGTTKDDGEDYIFMPPKVMFGATLMGVKDPNGYDVYIMERPKSAGS
jgi:catechol 2,3-dioxygenase-like lactoylglutathione lyase family enzyme